MANVWKIGSRWSDYGTSDSSIISIFRRNNVVFVGADRARNRFINEVKSGDYFAIADGYNVVAVAKALSKPTLINSLKINTVGYESDRFDYEECKDWVVGVRVKIVDLKDDQRIWYEKQGAFFKANQISQKVLDLYDNQNNEFSINSYTCTLFESKKEYKSVFDTHTRFIIPIYQRPYSWGENEIKPFLSDLVNNYFGKDKKGTSSEPMFIGTVQLSEKKYIDKKEYEQEVIDGQQRLTTLSVLLKVLSVLYPDCPKLLNLKFNWLESRINKKQNDYLTDFFNANEIDYRQNNTYFQNAVLIQNTFNDLIEIADITENSTHAFDIEKFCYYLFSSVYFVVIETYAGLSKTLQIFNAINTTGLDLNGGDLFKIRMYEYLTDKKNEDYTAFERISEIYQLIDEKNKQAGKHILSIQGILDIYKDILIAKYNLPDTLFQFGWETFYDRLFDSLLGIKEWEHFGKVFENKVDIQLDEMRDVVNVRFEWKNSQYVSSENMFALNLISWSRYGRYWRIVYLFLYKYRKCEYRYTNLSELLIVINKLFFIYSVIYAKSVYEIHSFMFSIQKSLINNSIEEVMNFIDEKLKSVKNEKQVWIRNTLEGYITDNAKKKNLICCLSAYLEERSMSNDIDELRRKLFDTRFDIEHIHANADETIIINDNLQNSIGNLVMLEEVINRSIQHAPFLKSDKSNKNKKEEFLKSKYSSVIKIAENKKWDNEDMEQRKIEETNKILQYLFE
ncbi:MAG: hypothetical protein ACJA2M_002237 [Polaribacter sp.]|jgi:uncharacterized protein with ParB-like and HNH nuclease domain